MSAPARVYVFNKETSVFESVAEDEVEAQIVSASGDCKCMAKPISSSS